MGIISGFRPFYEGNYFCDFQNLYFCLLCYGLCPVYAVFLFCLVGERYVNIDDVDL